MKFLGTRNKEYDMWGLLNSPHLRELPKGGTSGIYEHHLGHKRSCATLVSDVEPVTQLQPRFFSFSMVADFSLA